MFWRFGGYANISSIDSILEKPNVSLEELLDESDLIQELKQNNSKLIEFLREESTLQNLLEYVVADKPPHPDKATATKDEEPDRSSPISFFKKSASRSRSKSVNKSDAGGDAANEAAEQEDKGEALRKKYAYVACEVLSSDVWSITEAVLEYQNYLRDFWHYVSRPAPLDPLQAGYFTKVNESLLDKKTDEMLAFFKSLDHVVPDMLQHVDCPMIMDLLLKIISLEKVPGGQGIVDVSQVAPAVLSNC
jgi:SIT4-associating protein SAP185/190